MPPERTLRRIAACGAGTVVILYYFFFTWKSVGLYFDQDDMMNLYRTEIPPELRRKDRS